MSRRSEENYDTVHTWLRNTFGRASRCEKVSCQGISVKFNWALLRDKKCEEKRENFIQLCRSCHAKYDCTELTRKKISMLQRGKPVFSKEKYKEIALKFKGYKHTKEAKVKIGNATRGRVPIGAKSVLQFDKNGRFITRYNSMMEAQRTIGMTHDSLGKRFREKNTRTITHFGFIWERAMPLPK